MAQHQPSAIWKHGLTLGGIALGLFLLDNYLPSFWLTLLLLFGINSILAVALNITNGWTGLFSLGHGGIMLVGSYAAAFFTLPVAFKKELIALHLPDFMLNVQISLLPALILGGLAGTVFGVLLALPALRLKGLYFLLTTLGFNFIVITIAENLPKITNGPMGLRQFPAYTNVWWVWGIAVLLLYLALRLKNSYIGRAFVAIGKDQDLAEHLGINLFRYKLYAFGLSAFFTAMGGILWVHLILNLYPRAFSIHLVFQVVTMIVIGGLGSISGAVIGAAIITGFTEVLAPIEEGFTLFGALVVPRMLGLTTLLLAGILLIILITRPQGIMGEGELSLKPLKSLLIRRSRKQSENAPI
ncbi:MAG: branched-chain amino acid ABC transporter permease [Desulfobacterales bacterium]|nr:MAG: branched-chain amino acid ABC transporter permease [Desulfobacterales bacterium]